MVVGGQVNGMGRTAEPQAVLRETGCHRGTEFVIHRKDGTTSGNPAAPSTAGRFRAAPHPPLNSFDVTALSCLDPVREPFV